MLKQTIENYIKERVVEPTIKHIDYKIYWLRQKHCNNSIPVMQVDGKIGYKCEHRDT